MKTVGGSSCCEGKFILSYHGRKIADDELKNSSCEFEAKIKNAVVWKQSLSQIAPMSITLLATHGQSGGQVVNVAGYLKDNPCLVFDIKASCLFKHERNEVVYYTRHLSPLGKN